MHDRTRHCNSSFFVETVLNYGYITGCQGGLSGLQQNTSIKLDIRLHGILEETRQQHDLRSLLLADHHGLPVCHAGEISHTGIAAIAPELIRVGNHAARLGEYDSITCIALILEDSHLMVIRDVEINGTPYVLVMDTAAVPQGIKRVLNRLRDRIAEAMDAYA